MKFFLLFAISFLSFFWDLLMPESFKPSKAEIFIGETFSNAENNIKKKYPNIHTCGSGISMPGGPIRELTLCFQTKGPLTKEYLRKLLVECANELLNQINSHEDSQQFLIQYPFKIENVQIIIYNNGKNGENVFDPEICIASMTNGILTYKTDDPETKYKFKNIFSETYEEALEILGQES